MTPLEQDIVTVASYVLLGVLVLAALLVLVVMVLAIASALNQQSEDRELAGSREEHYAGCDAFAGWTEPTFDTTWPERRAA